MLPHFRNKAPVLLASLLLATPVAVQAKPVQPAKPTQAKPAQPAIYQQAKKDLSQQMYTLYRIVDRLARANELDQSPWQVAITSRYDPNAFASDVNLLPVYARVLQLLKDDASALACVVAREMGHHAKQHRPLTREEAIAMTEDAKREAEQEVMAARERDAEEAATDNLISSTGESITRNSDNGFFRSIGRVIFGGRSQPRISDEQREREIAALKRQEVVNQLVGRVKLQEVEADEAGYLYTTRAGFDSAGCNRALNVLSQMPGMRFLPGSERNKALEIVAAEHSTQALATEGKGKISATKPLSYEHSKNSTLLRINSRNGNLPQGDIDKLFGS